MGVAKVLLISVTSFLILAADLFAQPLTATTVTKEIAPNTLGEFEPLLVQELRSIINRKFVVLKTSTAPEELKESVLVLRKMKGKELLMGQNLLHNYFRFGLSQGRISYEAKLHLKQDALAQEMAPGVSDESQWEVSREFFSPEQSPRIFTEVFTPTAPKGLFGYTFSTTRWSDIPQEDLVEIESPILKSKRRITETNRADPLLSTGVSLNDLYPIGLHPHRLVVKKVSVVDAYMPRPLSSLKNKIREGCFEVIPSSDSMPLSSDALTVAPLRMIRVEYHSQEPFSLLPTGVLFFEPLYGAPLMHLQFDQQAKLARVGLHYYHYVPTSSASLEERREFFPSRAYVLNLKEKMKVSIEYTAQTVCSGG